MKYIHETEEFEMDSPTVVTFGKFDGVHSGHQKLFAIVSKKAEELDAISVVVTFDKIPLSICPSTQQHFITTNFERKDIIEKLGLDILIEYPFTENFMRTEPEIFIEEVIAKKLKAKCVVIGPDFCFGKDRRGDAEMICHYAKNYGYEAIVVEKEKYEDKEISSTFVREELKIGHMETVNMLLKRPYSIKGIVVKGNQFGRTINVPTVNIYPTDCKLLPPNGVYSSETIIDGEVVLGVTNIGTKPTVHDGKTISVETNLFDFNKNIYGKNIEVCLKHFQRPEMKFDSVETLKKQMESDAAFAKELFMIK